MTLSPVQKKLAKPGPRKLLALDGGGIRGLITIEVLAEIERILRETFRQGDDFVLADYFDYIGGTSVGAITAACLALGMPVAKIRAFFVENASVMFKKAHWWERLWYKYQCDELRDKIRAIIADMRGDLPGLETFDDTLGSPMLRTLLLLMMRNATTDSPWPVSNNPAARYNCDREAEGCNLRLPLWQLIRASTAAPTYFAPEAITVGSSTFYFDDGGMTPFPNPAFQLFLMSTLGCYNVGWATGEDQMLLVSIGTGAWESRRPDTNWVGNMLYQAATIPSVLIGANIAHQDLLCRVFGRCKAGHVMDAEIGDMIADQETLINPKLFTYLRYDADLSQQGLADLGLPGIRAENVQSMDSVVHIPEFAEIGKALGRKVIAEHFSRFPP